MRKTRLLMHVCCAPCFIAPWFHLSEQHDVTAFWFNHNIHPFTEFRKRLDTLRRFTTEQDIPLIVKEDYPVERFFRDSAYRETQRCGPCYRNRLEQTAYVAKRGKFEAFSTTLLYSKFQRHEMIREIAEQIAGETGIPFHYEDMRTWWKEGIERSRKAGMYRQQYCGCLFSEYERYRNDRRLVRGPNHHGSAAESRPPDETPAVRTGPVLDRS